MKNLVKEGKTLTYANSGSAIASGAVVVVGNQLGVAIADIAATTGIGELAMEGVFELPKTGGASTAMAVGSSPIWDVSAGAFIKEGSTPAAGDVSNAVTVWKAAADGDTTVQVKINTGKGTVTGA